MHAHPSDWTRLVLHPWAIAATVHATDVLEVSQQRAKICDRLLFSAHHPTFSIGRRARAVAVHQRFFQ